MRAFAAAAALALWSAPVGGGEGVSTRASLRARAASEGGVRVIVRLREGALREPAAHPRQPHRWRARQAAIGRAQLALLQEVTRVGGRRARRFRHLPLLALEVGPQALRALERSDWVEALEEDRLYAPALSSTIPVVEADPGQLDGFDGAGQAVAILDTGVDAGHVFLDGRVVAEACFSANGSCPDGSSQQIGPGAGTYCDFAGGCFHGTHVAGIAAGAGSGFSGVAPEASIIAVRVFSRLSGGSCSGAGEDPCALAFTSDIVAGLEHVFDLRQQLDIAVANMSLSGGAYGSESACDQANGALKAAVDQLRAVGIASVAASGNAGRTDALGSPACLSTVVSVGATTDGDQVAAFSNSAPFLSLLAPGVSVTSSLPPALAGFSFGTRSGTSMAAPHVSGAWAALRHSDPSAPVDAVFAALQQSGVPVTDVNDVTTPRIRVASALVALLGCAEGADPDGDGVCLDADNCSDRANPLQIDSDGDGYGNACDADYDGDGSVGILDFTVLRTQFGLGLGDPGYDPSVDSNADDQIGLPDFAGFRNGFGVPPGPSGLACAGTVPCSAP